MEGFPAQELIIELSPAMGYKRSGNMNAKLQKRALLLSYFTGGYNILEGILSILAGLMADSISLISFGLDSFVESLSGCIMIWRFRNWGRISEEEEEGLER